MTFRPLLALVLCLGLQTSLCTGGALSVVSGVSDFFAYQADDLTLMSYGAIGYLTCENNKSDTEVGSVTSNCGDASNCLLQAFQYAESQSLLAISSIDLHLLALRTFDTIHTPSVYTPKLLARSGPLYESAVSDSHTLLKRE
jgi:hypothetical protein